MTTSQADKVAAFRALHETGCFALPTPWDVGSARYLQALGFKALASSSAGFAWSLGKMDYQLTVEDVLGHLSSLCAATDLPVNADFEGGFAIEPEGVAANVARAAAAGLAGLSIEDRSPAGSARPLLDLDLAVARIYEAKGRPRFNPLIAHVCDMAMARRLAVFDAPPGPPSTRAGPACC